MAHGFGDEEGVVEIKGWLRRGHGEVVEKDGSAGKWVSPDGALALGERGGGGVVDHPLGGLGGGGWPRFALDDEACAYSASLHAQCRPRIALPNL